MEPLKVLLQQMTNESSVLLITKLVTLVRSLADGFQEITSQLIIQLHNVFINTGIDFRTSW